MKMMTVDAAKGVFMVAFADGPCAAHLAQRLGVQDGGVRSSCERAESRHYLAALVTQALGLHETQALGLHVMQPPGLGGAFTSTRTGTSAHRRTSAVKSASSNAAGSVRLTSFAAFWFPVGTHYYAPSRATSRGHTDATSRGHTDATSRGHTDAAARARTDAASRQLFVVGEAVSHNQGWTEGALETVDAVVPRIIRAARNG
jgi:hypothetical protein